MTMDLPPDVDLTIPAEIDAQYVGRYIAWDLLERKVIADAATLDEIIDAADAAFQAGRPIYYHFIPPPDATFVGGF